MMRPRHPFIPFKLCAFQEAASLPTRSKEHPWNNELAVHSITLLGLPMKNRPVLDQATHIDLLSIYEEIMWLAKRPRTSPSAARAWYTHVVAGRHIRRIRYFSGKVSSSASKNEAGTLRLEHFKRIQTTLTQLVAKHLRSGEDSAEFIRVLLDCEQVHIVTFDENYQVLKAKGDYTKAGIHLLDWDKIPKIRREHLWNKMLKGKVANASEFKP
jgi:hypothetical protein